MARADAELELSNMRCAQLKEREKSLVAEVESWLGKELEELKAKNTTLETEKASVGVELEQLQDNIMGMCGESVNQTFWKSHLL